LVAIIFFIFIIASIRCYHLTINLHVPLNHLLAHITLRNMLIYKKNIIKFPCAQRLTAVIFSQRDSSM